MCRFGKAIIITGGALIATLLVSFLTAGIILLFIKMFETNLAIATTELIKAKKDKYCPLVEPIGIMAEKMKKITERKKQYIPNWQI